MLKYEKKKKGPNIELTSDIQSSPEVESNLIPVPEAEAAQPPVCLAPIVDPSGMASILSFSAETKSV